MASFGREIVALLRALRLSRGLVQALLLAKNGVGGVVETYDRVVSPMVGLCIVDEPARANIDEALRFTSAKVSYFVEAYCGMAQLAFDRELAVLGGAFSRIYDDLMDDVSGRHIERRLAAFFDDQEFTPETPHEALLKMIYTSIDTRLGRSDRDGLIYQAMRSLHEFQILSQQQNSPAIPALTLDKISKGKGGYANITLFGLMRESMSASEKEVIMQLGESIQFMDDYLDIDIDRASGITTVVTRGAADLTDLVDNLWATRRSLGQQYGRVRSRRLVAVLYIFLMASWIKRRFPATRVPPAVAGAGASRNPLLVLIQSGTGVAPRGPRNT